MKELDAEIEKNRLERRTAAELEQQEVLENSKKLERELEKSTFVKDEKIALLNRQFEVDSSRSYLPEYSFDIMSQTER